jgi:Protein of unknown function (DUF3732)
VKFVIRKVILWPKKRTLTPRIIEFQPGVVNVITGASQTGKSALIPIVDYCLGAGKCAIPVGIIREAVEWFGVLVATSQGQLLLARREPGEKQATDEMHMIEGVEIPIPQRISESNANRTFVKHYLDELAGLTSLDIVVGATSAYRGRPAFRDLAAFNFQPQNIVANPDVLFFKADTTEHKEKLKNVLPYALGVTTSDVLAKRYELDEIRREHRSAVRELGSLREGAHQWITELRVNLSRARELGLLPADAAIELPEPQAIASLRSVVTRQDSTENPRRGAVPRPSVITLAEEIVSLQHAEQEHAIRLSQLRKRWIEMSKLREAAGAYSRALQVEEDRLGISRWLYDRSSEVDQPCPICGNHLDAVHNHLAELVTGLEEVERGSASFRALPPSFDKEWAQVRNQIRDVTNNLTAVQTRIAALQQSSELERRKRYTELNASRFVGILEAGLTQYDRFMTDDSLKEKVEKLALKISDLAAEVDENALREKLKRVLLQVSVLNSQLLPKFGVEDPQDVASLSVTELTLKISRAQRTDYLFEVGSGSNWLGYHLSLMLALHQYFLSLSASSVPAFLMIDQPSQVYFPKKLAGRKTAKDLDPKLDDDDAKRVRNLFLELASVTQSEKESKRELQLIVVDHAGKSVWGDIPGVHFVDEWRGSKKLVPQSWIDDPKALAN